MTICIIGHGDVYWVTGDLAAYKMSTKHPIQDMVCLDAQMFGLSEDGRHLYQWQPSIAEKHAADLYTITTCNYSANIYSIDQKQAAYSGFCDVSPLGNSAALYFTERSQNNSVLAGRPPRISHHTRVSVMDRPWGSVAVAADAAPEKDLANECKRFVEAEDAKDSPVGEDKEKVAQAAFLKEYARNRRELSKDGNRLDAKHEFTAGVVAFRSYLRAKRATSGDSPLRPHERPGLAIKLVEYPIEGQDLQSRETVAQRRGRRRTRTTRLHGEENVDLQYPDEEEEEEEKKELNVPRQDNNSARQERLRSITTRKGSMPEGDNMNFLTSRAYSSARYGPGLADPGFSTSRAELESEEQKVLPAQPASRHLKVQSLATTPRGLEEIARSFRSAADKIKAMRKGRTASNVGSMEIPATASQAEKVTDERRESPNEPVGFFREDQVAPAIERMVAILTKGIAADFLRRLVLLKQAQDYDVNMRRSSDQRLAVEKLSTVMTRAMARPVIFEMISDSHRELSIANGLSRLQDLCETHMEREALNRLRDEENVAEGKIGRMVSVIRRKELANVWGKWRRLHGLDVAERMRRRTGAKLIQEVVRRRLSTAVGRFRNDVALSTARDELTRLRSEYDSEKERQRQRLELKEGTIQELQGSLRKLAEYKNALKQVSTRHFLTVMGNVCSRLAKQHFAVLKRRQGQDAAAQGESVGLENEEVDATMGHGVGYNGGNKAISEHSSEAADDQPPVDKKEHYEEEDAKKPEAGVGREQTEPRLVAETRVRPNVSDKVGRPREEIVCGTAAPQDAQTAGKGRAKSSLELGAGRVPAGTKSVIGRHVSAKGESVPRDVTAKQSAHMTPATEQRPEEVARTEEPPKQRRTEEVPPELLNAHVVQKPEQKQLSEKTLSRVKPMPKGGEAHASDVTPRPEVGVSPGEDDGTGANGECKTETVPNPVFVSGEGANVPKSVAVPAESESRDPGLKHAHRNAKRDTVEKPQGKDHTSALEQPQLAKEANPGDDLPMSAQADSSPSATKCGREDSKGNDKRLHETDSVPAPEKSDRDESTLQAVSGKGTVQRSADKDVVAPAETRVVPEATKKKDERENASNAADKGRAPAPAENAQEKEKNIAITEPSLLSAQKKPKDEHNAEKAGIAAHDKSAHKHGSGRTDVEAMAQSHALEPARNAEGATQGKTETAEKRMRKESDKCGPEVSEQRGATAIKGNLAETVHPSIADKEFAAAGHTADERPADIRMEEEKEKAVIHHELATRKSAKVVWDQAEDGNENAESIIPSHRTDFATKSGEAKKQLSERSVVRSPQTELGDKSEVDVPTAAVPKPDTITHIVESERAAADDDDKHIVDATNRSDVDKIGHAEASDERLGKPETVDPKTDIVPKTIHGTRQVETEAKTETGNIFHIGEQKPAEEILPAPRTDKTTGREPGEIVEPRPSDTVPTEVVRELEPGMGKEETANRSEQRDKVPPTMAETDKATESQHQLQPQLQDKEKSAPITTPPPKFAHANTSDDHSHIQSCRQTETGFVEQPQTALAVAVAPNAGNRADKKSGTDPRRLLPSRSAVVRDTCGQPEVRQHKSAAAVHADGAHKGRDMPNTIVNIVAKIMEHPETKVQPDSERPIPAATSTNPAEDSKGEEPHTTIAAAVKEDQRESAEKVRWEPRTATKDATESLVWPENATSIRGGSKSGIVGPEAHHTKEDLSESRRPGEIGKSKSGAVDAMGKAAENEIEESEIARPERGQAPAAAKDSNVVPGKEHSPAPITAPQKFETKVDPGEWHAEVHEPAAILPLENEEGATQVPAHSETLPREKLEADVIRGAKEAEAVLGPDPAKMCENQTASADLEDENKKEHCAKEPMLGQREDEGEVAERSAAKKHKYNNAEQKSEDAAEEKSEEVPEPPKKAKGEMVVPDQELDLGAARTGGEDAKMAESGRRPDGENPADLGEKADTDLGVDMGEREEAPITEPRGGYHHKDSEHEPSVPELQKKAAQTDLEKKDDPIAESRGKRQETATHDPNVSDPPKKAKGEIIVPDEYLNLVPSYIPNREEVPIADPHEDAVTDRPQKAVDDTMNGAEGIPIAESCGKHTPAQTVLPNACAGLNQPAGIGSVRPLTQESTNVAAAQKVDHAEVEEPARDIAPQPVETESNQRGRLPDTEPAGREETADMAVLADANTEGKGVAAADMVRLKSAAEIAKPGESEVPSEAVPPESHNVLELAKSKNVSDKSTTMMMPSLERFHGVARPEETPLSRDAKEEDKKISAPMSGSQASQTRLDIINNPGEMPVPEDLSHVSEAVPSQGRDGAKPSGGEKSATATIKAPSVPVQEKSPVVARTGSDTHTIAHGSQPTSLPHEGETVQTPAPNEVTPAHAVAKVQQDKEPDDHMPDKKEATTTVREIPYVQPRSEDVSAPTQDFTSPVTLQIAVPVKESAVAEGKIDVVAAPDKDEDEKNAVPQISPQDATSKLADCADKKEAHSFTETDRVAHTSRPAAEIPDERADSPIADSAVARPMREQKKQTSPTEIAEPELFSAAEIESGEGAWPSHGGVSETATATATATAADDKHAGAPDVRDQAEHRDMPQHGVSETDLVQKAGSLARVEETKTSIAEEDKAHISEDKMHAAKEKEHTANDKEHTAESKEYTEKETPYKDTSCVVPKQEHTMAQEETPNAGGGNKGPEQKTDSAKISAEAPHKEENTTEGNEHIKYSKVHIAEDKEREEEATPGKDAARDVPKNGYTTGPEETPNAGGDNKVPEQKPEPAEIPAEAPHKAEHTAERKEHKEADIAEGEEHKEDEETHGKDAARVIPKNEHTTGPEEGTQDADINKVSEQKPDSAEVPAETKKEQDVVVPQGDNTHCLEPGVVAHAAATNSTSLKAAQTVASQGDSRAERQNVAAEITHPGSAADTANKSDSVLPHAAEREKTQQIPSEADGAIPHVQESKSILVGEPKSELVSKPELRPEPKLEPELKSQQESKLGHRLELKSQQKSVPELRSKLEPRLQQKPEPELKPELKPEQESEVAPQPESTAAMHRGEESQRPTEEKAGTERVREDALRHKSPADTTEEDKAKPLSHGEAVLSQTHPQTRNVAPDNDTIGGTAGKGVAAHTEPEPEPAKVAPLPPTEDKREPDTDSTHDIPAVRSSESGPNSTAKAQQQHVSNTRGREAPQLAAKAPSASNEEPAVAEDNKANIAAPSDKPQIVHDAESESATDNAVPKSVDIGKCEAASETTIPLRDSGPLQHERIEEAAGPKPVGDNGKSGDIPAAEAQTPPKANTVSDPQSRDAADDSPGDVHPNAETDKSEDKSETMKKNDTAQATEPEMPKPQSDGNAERAVPDTKTETENAAQRQPQLEEATELGRGITAKGADELSAVENATRRETETEAGAEAEKKIDQPAAETETNNPKKRAPETETAHNVAPTVESPPETVFANEGGEVAAKSTATKLPQHVHEAERLEKPEKLQGEREDEKKAVHHTSVPIPQIAHKVEQPEKHARPSDTSDAHHSYEDDQPQEKPEEDAVHRASVPVPRSAHEVEKLEKNARPLVTPDAYHACEAEKPEEKAACSANLEPFQRGSEVAEPKPKEEEDKSEVAAVHDRLISSPRSVHEVGWPEGAKAVSPQSAEHEVNATAQDVSNVDVHGENKKSEEDKRDAAKVVSSHDIRTKEMENALKSPAVEHPAEEVEEPVEDRKHESVAAQGVSTLHAQLVEEKQEEVQKEEAKKEKKKDEKKEDEKKEDEKKEDEKKEEEPKLSPNPQTTEKRENALRSTERDAEIERPASDVNRTELSAQPDSGHVVPLGLPSEVEVERKDEPKLGQHVSAELEGKSEAEGQTKEIAPVLVQNVSSTEKSSRHEHDADAEVDEDHDKDIRKRAAEADKQIVSPDTELKPEAKIAENEAPIQHVPAAHREHEAAARISSGTADLPLQRGSWDEHREEEKRIPNITHPTEDLEEENDRHELAAGSDKGNAPSVAESKLDPASEAKPEANEQNEPATVALHTVAELPKPRESEDSATVPAVPLQEVEIETEAGRPEKAAPTPIAGLPQRLESGAEHPLKVVKHIEPEEHMQKSDIPAGELPQPTSGIEPEEKQKASGLEEKHMYKSSAEHVFGMGKPKEEEENSKRVSPMAEPPQCVWDVKADEKSNKDGEETKLNKEPGTELQRKTNSSPSIEHEPAHATSELPQREPSANPKSRVEDGTDELSHHAANAPKEAKRIHELPQPAAKAEIETKTPMEAQHEDPYADYDDIPLYAHEPEAEDELYDATYELPQPEIEAEMPKESQHEDPHVTHDELLACEAERAKSEGKRKDAVRPGKATMRSPMRELPLHESEAQREEKKHFGRFMQPEETRRDVDPSYLPDTDLPQSKTGIEIKTEAARPIEAEGSAEVIPNALAQSEPEAKAVIESKVKSEVEGQTGDKHEGSHVCPASESPQQEHVDEFDKPNGKHEVASIVAEKLDKNRSSPATAHISEAGAQEQAQIQTQTAKDRHASPCELPPQHEHAIKFDKSDDKHEGAGSDTKKHSHPEISHISEAEAQDQTAKDRHVDPSEASQPKEPATKLDKSEAEESAPMIVGQPRPGTAIEDDVLESAAGPESAIQHPHQTEAGKPMDMRGENAQKQGKVVKKGKEESEEKGEENERQEKKENYEKEEKKGEQEKEKEAKEAKEEKHEKVARPELEPKAKSESSRTSLTPQPKPETEAAVKTVDNINGVADSAKSAQQTVPPPHSEAETERTGREESIAAVPKSDETAAVSHLQHVFTPEEKMLARESPAEVEKPKKDAVVVHTEREDNRPEGAELVPQVLRQSGHERKKPESIQPSGEIAHVTEAGKSESEHVHSADEKDPLGESKLEAEKEAQNPAAQDKSEVAVRHHQHESEDQTPAEDRCKADRSLGSEETHKSQEGSASGEMPKLTPSVSPVRDIGQHATEVKAETNMQNDGNVAKTDSHHEPVEPSIKHKESSAGNVHVPPIESKLESAEMRPLQQPEIAPVPAETDSERSFEELKERHAAAHNQPAYSDTTAVCSPGESLTVDESAVKSGADFPLQHEGLPTDAHPEGKLARSNLLPGCTIADVLRESDAEIGEDEAKTEEKRSPADTASEPKALPAGTYADARTETATKTAERLELPLQPTAVTEKGKTTPSFEASVLPEKSMVRTAPVPADTGKHSVRREEDDKEDISDAGPSAAVTVTDIVPEAYDETEKALHSARTLPKSRPEGRTSHPECLPRPAHEALPAATQRENVHPRVEEKKETRPIPAPENGCSSYSFTCVGFTSQSIVSPGELPLAGPFPEEIVRPLQHDLSSQSKDLEKYNSPIEEDANRHPYPVKVGEEQKHQLHLASSREPANSDLPLQVHPPGETDEKNQKSEKSQSPTKSRNAPYQTSDELWRSNQSPLISSSFHMPNIEDISGITAKGKDAAASVATEKGPKQLLSYDAAEDSQSRAVEERPLSVRTVASIPGTKPVSTSPHSGIEPDLGYNVDVRKELPAKREAEESQTRAETLSKNMFASCKSGVSSLAREVCPEEAPANVAETMERQKAEAYKQRGYAAGLRILSRVVRVHIAKSVRPLQSLVINKKDIAHAAGCKKLVTAIRPLLKRNVYPAYRSMARFAQHQRLALKQLRLGVAALRSCIRPRLCAIFSKVAACVPSRKRIIATTGVEKLREAMEIAARSRLREAFAKFRAEVAESVKKHEEALSKSEKGARLVRKLLSAKMRVLVEAVKSRVQLAAMCGDIRKQAREKGKKEGAEVLARHLRRSAVRARLDKWRNVSSEDRNRRISASRVLKSVTAVHRRIAKDAFEELKLHARMQKALLTKQTELNKLIGDKDAELKTAAERQLKSLQEKELALRISRERETAAKLRSVLSRKLASHFDTLLYKSLATTYIASSDAVPSPAPREESSPILHSPVEEESYGSFADLSSPAPMASLRARIPSVSVDSRSPEKIKVSVLAASTTQVEESPLVTVSPVAKSTPSSEDAKFELSPMESPESQFSPATPAEKVQTQKKEETALGLSTFGKLEEEEKIPKCNIDLIPTQTKEPGREESDKKSGPVPIKQKLSPKALSRFVTKPKSMSKSETALDFNVSNKPRTTKELAEPDTRLQQNSSPEPEQARMASPFAPMSLEFPPSDSSQRSPFTSYPASGRQSLAAETASMPVTPTKDDSPLKRFQAVEMLNSPDVLPEGKSRLSSEENSAIGMADPVELETPSSKSFTPRVGHRILGHAYEENPEPLNREELRSEFATGRLIIKSKPKPKKRPAVEEEKKRTRTGSYGFRPAALEPKHKAKTNRYDHSRFMQAFSQCFIKYHEQMLMDERRSYPSTSLLEPPPLPPGRKSRRSSALFKESPIPSRRLRYPALSHALPNARKQSNFGGPALTKASSEKELRELLTGMNGPLEERFNSVRPSQLLAPTVSSHKDASKMFRSRLRKFKQIRTRKARFVRNNIRKASEHSQHVSVSPEQGRDRTVQTDRPHLLSGLKSTRGAGGATTMLQSSVGSLTMLSKRKGSGDDYLTLNKQFIREMSSINHEINSHYNCLARVPRFKVPKPDLVFQLTRYKIHMQSKSLASRLSCSVNSAVAMQSPLLEHTSQPLLALNQSQQ